MTRLQDRINIWFEFNNNYGVMFRSFFVKKIILFDHCIKKKKIYVKKKITLGMNSNYSTFGGVVFVSLIWVLKLNWLTK